MERLMLLDGYGLVYRGYFALPPLTTSKGDLVNGVFGFASIVLRGLADLQPAATALKAHLPQDEVQAVGGWLVDIAEAVAGASKGVSEGEKETVAKIAGMFGGAPPA